jgi:lipoate-protein ligase A
MDVHDLKQALLRGLFGESVIPTYDLESADWEQIHQFTAARYGSWSWNYGHSPAFNIQRSERFPVGMIDARIDVDKGKIQALKIFGDFSGERNVRELEGRLVGIRYDPVAIAGALDDLDISSYFGELDKTEFVALLY